MWLNIQHHLNSVLYNRTRWNGSQTAISIFISCQPLEGPSLVTSWCPACCLDNVPEGHVHKLCSCHKEISGNKHELTFSLTSEFFILIFLQHGFFFVCVCTSVHSGKHIFGCVCQFESLTTKDKSLSIKNLSSLSCQTASHNTSHLKHRRNYIDFNNDYYLS